MHEKPTTMTTGMSDVEMARIMSVNSDTYTAHAKSLATNREWDDLGIATNYAHHLRGEGIHVLPEPGATCIVCTPGDGGLPFILGFLEDPSDGPSYRGRKPRLNPGDISIGTRDDNKITVRRGGVIQIESTALAQTIFIPVVNTIRSYFENMENICVGGEEEWHVSRVFPEPEGSGVSYTLRCREFAEDPDISVRLKLGRHKGDLCPDGTTPIFTLYVGKGVSTYKFKVNLAGNNFVNGNSEKKVLVGTYKLVTGGDIEITTAGNMAESITGSKTTDVLVDIIESAESRIIEKCTEKIVDAVLIRLGGDASNNPAVLGREFLQWAITHSHGSGAPITPAPISALSSVILLK